MDFEDVYLVSQNLQTVEQSRLDELEAWLKHPLPLGYRDYMSQLGLGVYHDLLIVFPPEKIQEIQGDHREYIDFHYEEFFEEQQHILSFENALNSIHVADSSNGDIIVYTPELDGKLYVLERYNSDIYTIDEGFYSPLTWTHSEQSAWDFLESASFPFFTTFENRSCHNFGETKNLNIDLLTKHIMAYWSNAETHLQSSEDVTRVLCRGCDGIVSIHHLKQNTRVQVSIGFDKKYLNLVEAFSQTLEPFGLQVTWRQ